MPNANTAGGNTLGPWVELREWRYAKGFSLSALTRESTIWVAHFWGQVNYVAEDVAVNLVSGLVAELRAAA